MSEGVFLLRAFVWLSLLAAPVCAAAPDQTFRFDIPQADASEALMRVAQQASTPLLVPFDLVRARQANTLHGEFTLKEGLYRLLDGTGLAASIDGMGVIVVNAAPESNKKLQGEGNMNSLNKKSLLGSVSAFVLSVFGVNTHAQDGQSAAGQKEKGAVLDEIVVTAQRYEQSLQKTPVSVVAVSGDDLQTLGVASFNDLDSFVPNFSTGFGQGYSNWAVLTIRGLGGGEGFVYQEPSVGVYIDDIYYPRAQGAMLDLVDVERVEVLRGPQGTLFGRNTSGGAVRYISKKPDRELGGKITGATGNYKRRDMQSVANIPLGDTLSTRFTFASKSRDGFVTRLNDGVRMGDINVVAMRGQLRWRPTTRWDVNLSVDAIQAEDHGVARDIPLIDPTDTYPTRLGDPGYNASLVTPSRYTVVGGDPDRNENESHGITGTIQYDLTDNMSIKSLTGYRRSDALNIQDWDQTPYVLNAADARFNFSNISQELQMDGSSFSDRLKWVAGLYYFHESAYQDGRRHNPVDPPDSPEIRDVDTTSYAVFGQGTFKLTERLGVTAGIRWSRDDKEYFSLRGAASARNSDDWTSITPRVGLEYQFTDDVMAYVSAAKGFKSGGFNDTPRPGQLDNGLVPFDPENLWTYEAGFRSELADRRIRFNGTFFYTDYKDIQTSTTFFDPLVGTRVQITQNAAAATVKGVEIEALARLTDNLVMRFSGGWIDAQYDDVSGALTLSLDTPFQRTPEYSYTAGATYDHPFANDAAISFNIDYSWKDEQTNSNNNLNNVVLPSYGLLSSRLSYRPPSEKWSVSLFGTNLLDKEYLISAFDPSTRSNFMGFVQHDLGRPREYGLEVSVSF